MTFNKTMLSNPGTGTAKRRLRLLILASFAVAVTLPFALTSTAQGVVEAPAGFDGLTNGLE